MTPHSPPMPSPDARHRHVAVVIPSYRVSQHLLDVIARIPESVNSIHVVDDACPESSGRLVAEHCADPRVRVHFNERNLGVGGAVLRGYREAIACGAQVIVKMDGDGQMDPHLLPAFINPILDGEADYAKGNRFFDLANIQRMPAIRIFGNAILSFLAKFSTGYWDIFDPTNGYTCIHADVARRLAPEKLSHRFFFETDILFRLNTLRAVVVDIPMDAKYDGESSNLRISRITSEFLFKHARNFCKRVFYNYYLRDASVASIELPLGMALAIGGLSLGGYSWVNSSRMGIETSAGTVMLSALPIILGLQFLLGFLNHDIASIPRRPIHKPLDPSRAARGTGQRPGQG